MDKSYLSNPYRYVYAPRSLSEAYKDAEYASAIHVYEEKGSRDCREFLSAALVLLGICFMIYLFATL